MFFFEKKNQKTFAVGIRASWSSGASGDEGAGAKVFCFFFSKKKAFLPLQVSPHAD
jgi:hypothetical protein